MVDNSENILVEFDYNNIFLVDPNKVIDDDGRAKDRNIKQENLVIYANLECKVLPRTKLALGVASNDALQNLTLATINFLNPGNKTFLENSYTDEITGKDTLKGKGVNQVKLEKVGIINENKNEEFFIRQQTLSNGKLGSVDNGLLGITSINIRQNTSFEPQITIQMEDVRGRALFESGDNSPYAPFFNLPYPIFYLTLKGYFGKAIRLPLMLHKFNARYDTTSGNFKITLDFFTYKFTVLTEIAVGSLQATPHMYTSNFQITKTNNTISLTETKSDETISRGYQKIKEVYSEYISKGLLPEGFPELTIAQLQDKLKLFLKNELEEFTKVNLKPIDDAQLYQDTLNEYRGRIFNYTDSWFRTYCDQKNNFFILVRGLERIPIYTLKEQFRSSSNGKTEAENKLREIVNELNQKLSENKTFGIDPGSYTIGNKPPTKSTITNKIQFNSFSQGGTFVLPDKINFGTGTNTGNIDLYLTYRELSGNTNPSSLDIQTLRQQLISNNLEKNPTDYPYFYFSGVGSFFSYIEEMDKTLNATLAKLEDELTQVLSTFIQNNKFLGFKPTIRNVLGVIFANGEAFIRLLDDVHTKAWDSRNSTDKKAVIFDPSVSSASPDIPQYGQVLNQPVYPWPQFIIQTDGENGKEKYEIKYPGDSDVLNRTKADNPRIWPEVEFVEEYIKGFTRRLSIPTPPKPILNEKRDVFRISFNPIEFPIENNVYGNKEEVKYFFEIYERVLWVSSYSKLSRATDFIENLDSVSVVISEGEVQNIKQSLGTDNPFLTDKLKNNPINLTTLKNFSNGGIGENWQNYIRGIFNTSYISNKTNNASFELFDSTALLFSTITEPQIGVNSIDKFKKYVNENNQSNVFDFSDTYPFTNQGWVSDYLSNGESIKDVKLAFNTTKSILYNETKKTISNFDKNGEDIKFNKPFSNYPFKNTVLPKINSPYTTEDLEIFFKRAYEPKTNLITEGQLLYRTYIDGLVSISQTTSMLNTPFFINAIQKGIENFRNNDTNPFVAAAYLFLNSLPLISLRETYKKINTNNNLEDLDYIFATFKKFGAIHKLPYAFILKYGAIWHRYKTFIETNNDIISSSWTGFSYVDNYDPINGDTEKEYNLIINNNQQVDIILQKNSVFGVGPFPESSTLINVGFYPKLINDFNVFFQGYPLIESTYTSLDVQSAITSGLTFNYVSSAIIDFPNGFDKSNRQRDLRIIPWSLTVKTQDGKFEYPLPSHGSLFNQTKNECFENGKIKKEVLNNQGMYDGSVRLFWGAPHYGFIDGSDILKPTISEYLNNIKNYTSEQSNFSIGSFYTKVSEIFSVFNKDILDLFEKEFLIFSKSIYDYEGFTPLTTLNGVFLEPPIQDDIIASYKNFQMLMRKSMILPTTTGNNGDEVIQKIQEIQLKQFNSYLEGFLNYDVVFKYGNPSNYDRKLFYSFSNLPFIDGYTFDRYSVLTPNTLPIRGGNVTLSASRNNPQNTLAWKALLTYVGFSEIPELTYTDSGSYITDFFIDLNIAFTAENIQLFAPMIKIYATQKLNQFQTNKEPKPAPPINPTGNLIAIASLKDGFTINIYQSGPYKYAVYKTPKNEVSFESSKSFINDIQNFIDEIIILIYGSLASSPTQNQYIVNLQKVDNSLTENYPIIPTPNGFSKGIFFDSTTNYILKLENFINKILDNINSKLNAELESISEIKVLKFDSEIRDAPKTKIELYDSFKAFNDKWIAGADFKTKTLFEDIMILDRASRNIGDIILIDLFKLTDLLDTISPENTMEGLIKTILSDNRFVYMNLPSYVNFYGVQDATKNPKPKIEGSLEFANTLFGTFTNVDYRDSRSKLICFFPGKPSEQLAVNSIDWRYRNDAFDLRRTDNPLVENQIGKKDFDKSNRVVGFNVDIGIQNQSIFKSFSVGQENGLSTAESLQILNEMANQAGGRLGTTQSVSLYNLYKNRSYTCSLSMMGNALIQPTMYFNLRYVPMFYGPYYITEVNHSISQGDFTTEITGVRQATAALSKVDDYLQSLKYTFVRNIIDQKINEFKQRKEAEIRDNRLTNEATDYITSSSAKPINTLDSNGNCVADPQYDKYTVVTTSLPSASITLADMKNRIQSQTNNVNLQSALFAWFYYCSVNNEQFTAKGYNYGAISISPNSIWSETLKNQFFNKKQYFCSNQSNTFVIFESVFQNINFFITLWEPRIGQLTDLSPSSVYRFTFINSFSDYTIGIRRFSQKENESNYDLILKIFQLGLEKFNQIP